MRKIEASHLSGEELYGDDFASPEIAEWFAAEERGYFDMASTDYSYRYHTLNHHYLFRHLKGRFTRCLALGCARGDEILPIARRIDEIIAVEPAHPWWSDRIGDTPARYIMPSPDGRIDLPDDHVDLITAFGVLHHIPNVSAVMQELGRVAAPGAVFLLREPSHSQGDWRVPRKGLTQNERGIAPKWMLAVARESGFDAEIAVHHDFGPLSHLTQLFGIDKNQHVSLLRLDRLLATFTAWNHRYWRTATWQKFAPSTMSYVLRRR